MSETGSAPFLTRKRALLLAAAAVAVAATVWVVTTRTEENITWAEARVDDLVMRVDVEGTIASTDSSMLTPPATARRMFDFTISMMAPEGEEVGVGTPVLAFDTSALQIRLRDLQTRAQQASKNLDRLDRNLEQQRLGLELRLAQAEANLRQAQLQVEVPEDLSSARQLEKARLDVQIAQIEVESVKLQISAAEQSAAAQRAVLEGNRTRAERDVAELEATMEQMTVRAPRSGTVIYVADRMGQKKKVGDSAWRNEEIIELPNLRSLVGRGEVNEPDAGRIAEGQPFRIRLDAHPEIEYTGVIGSISRAVQRKSFSRNPLKAVRVELVFDETDQMRMRPGMRFRGNIETERIAAVLLIPSSAVFPSADGPIVYRKGLVGYEGVPVTLGRRNEAQVEVLDGLQPGDLVAETNPEAS